jgi:hypothetical protein
MATPTHYPTCPVCAAHTATTQKEPPARVATAEAAHYTNLAESTLRYYRHANIGPKSYTIGVRVFYDIGDLDEWLAAQKAASLRGGVR